MNKIAIVTGANAGIGYETALELSKQEFQLILICRSQQKCEKAKKSILEEVAHAKINYFVADLSSQQQIKDVASQINAKYATIDVLINNAGTWISNLTYTEDEIEKVFAVNHLAGFLLTHLLMPLLKSSEDARVINISSESHRQVKSINFDDVYLTKNYHGLKSYAQSKLANIMFATEFERRTPYNNISSYAVQPGLVHTDIGIKVTNKLHAFAWKVRRTFWKSKTPKDGAATSIFLATNAEVTAKSGFYWDDCKVRTSSSYSTSKEECEKLWELSEELCSIDNYFN